MGPNLPPIRATFWFALAATAAIRMGHGSIVPLMPLHARAHGLSIAMIALMANAFLLSSALSQPVTGQVSDRWGRLPVMLGGALLNVLAGGLFAADVDSSFYVLVYGIAGLGSGAFGLSVRALVADLVDLSERGRAIGMLLTADMVGSLVGPMVGGTLYNLLGERAPFLAWALLAGSAALLLLPALRSGQRGTRPHAATGPMGRVLVEAGRTLVRPAFWALVLPGAGTAYLAGLYGVTWSLYMERAGASAWQISLSYTLPAIPALLLMIPLGRLSDQVGRRLMLGIGGVLSVLTISGYSAFPAPAVLLAFCVLDGVAGSFLGPATQALLLDITPDQNRGRYLGLAGAAQAGLMMVFTFTIGYLYERFDPTWLYATGAAVQGLAVSGTAWLITRRPPALLRQSIERAGLMAEAPVGSVAG